MTFSHYRQRFFTRLFVGQSSLATWLDELGLTKFDWNLEIVSPFFDAHDATALRSLVETLQPAECRVHLPMAGDGTAQVTQEQQDAVAELAHWSALPSKLLERGRGAVEKLAPRRVHAKVYRLWNSAGQEVVLVGSPNLTAAAHSHARAGNLEVAFLLDRTDEKGRRRWWLKRLDEPPAAWLDEARDETEDHESVFVDVSLRYDWSRSSLEVRIAGGEPGALVVDAPDGTELFTVRSPRRGPWTRLPDADAEKVRALLVSTSFVTIRHERGTWCILVREEGMHQRPSLLLVLTPEEILRYWSLLSDAQKEAFLLRHIGPGVMLEGVVAGTPALVAIDTVFDRFAGVFHAFERLHRHVVDAVADGREQDAAARLFGAKYDSLPVLLEKILEREDGDPVLSYLSFLSARQVADRVKAECGEFWRAHRHDRERLDALLGKTDRLRDALLGDAPERDAFFEWFEPAFLNVASGPTEEHP